MNLFKNKFTMKKLGILFFSLLIGLGVAAAPKQPVAQVDSTKASAKVDSISPSDYANLDPKEAILLQKLTPEQLMSLEQERLENERVNDMPFSKLGLLAICLAPFILVILIVYLESSYRDRQSKRKHELYLKALEAGQTIPESYFKSPEKKKSSNLQKGAIWLGIGLAITISVLVIGKIETLFLGIIPTFVGIAYLIVYFIEDKKKTTKEVDE